MERIRRLLRPKLHRKVTKKRRDRFMSFTY